MAGFAYNNAKNLSTGYTFFELNFGYHLCFLFKKDINPRFQSKSVDKLSAELCNLMTVCRENLYHAQKFPKRAHNRNVKPRSYAFDDKIWLNSKYIKTKHKQKLEAKFFRPFQVFHPIEK